MSGTFDQWCDRLTAWRTSNSGSIPKQTNDASEQHALANWIRKIRLRKHKSTGPKPSQRQLTSDEVAKFEAALAPGLCHGEEAAAGHAADSVEDASMSDAALASGLCHGESSAISAEFEHWCTKLISWRRANAGAFPKQTKDQSVEHVLANWMKKAKIRKHKSLGTAPSLRQLTCNEVALFDAALAPGLCLGEEEEGACSANDAVADQIEIDSGLCLDGDTDAAHSVHTVGEEGLMADANVALPRKRVRRKSAVTAASSLCTLGDSGAKLDDAAIEKDRQRRVMESYNNDDASQLLVQQIALESLSGGVAVQTKENKHRERQQAAAEALRNVRDAKRSRQVGGPSSKPDTSSVRPLRQEVRRSRRYDVGFWGEAGGRQKPGRKKKKARGEDDSEEEQETRAQAEADNKKDDKQCRALLQNMSEEQVRGLLLRSRYNLGGSVGVLEKKMLANEMLDDRWLQEAAEAFHVSQRQLVEGKWKYVKQAEVVEAVILKVCASRAILRGSAAEEDENRIHDLMKEMTSSRKRMYEQASACRLSKIREMNDNDFRELIAVRQCREELKMAVVSEVIAKLHRAPVIENAEERWVS